MIRMIKSILCILFFEKVYAFPSLLQCETEIAIGSTIMSSPAFSDSSRSLVIERDGEILTCGEDSYVPGETLLARIDDVTSVRYVMELSSGTFDSEGDGESCDGTRVAKGTGGSSPDGSGETFTAPADGSNLVLTGGFAGSFGPVSIMDSCTLFGSDDATSAPTIALPTVVDLASSIDELSSLVDAVVSEDLAGVLSPPATVTVFAPNNDAFAAAGDVGEALADILRYHIVSGSFAAADLMDGKELTALSGEVITVSISGSTVSLNDGQATVVTADLEASNGFIHIIDAVLTPPDPPISVRGFLIDLYCWQLNPTTRIAIDGADLDENPEEHTIHCMRDVPQCRANGFGIVVEQSDGTYDLVYGFDEAGNEAVLDWLDTNTADDNIGVEVTVTGVVTGNDVVLNDLTVAELTSVVVRFHRDVISHTGFLIDILCWEREGHLAIDGADLDTNPQDHSIKCMRDVPICREMGHGILEPVEDGCGYDLAYTFDEAGNALALEFIDSTDKLDNIIVSVSGEIDTAGIMYVETLVAEDYQIHEGYLMDYYCWTLNPETRTAFDGADLMNSPEEHSIKCMREVPQCRVNGFGLMQLNDEGTAYNYTIDFDDDGDATALAFVDDATIEDDVYVRIQGVPVPDAGTNYFTLTGISIELLAEECRPGPIEDPDVDPEPSTVVDLASSIDELSSLVDAVVSEDLAGVLSPPATVTVFAPNNDAFAAAGDVGEALADILRYHIVSGSFAAADLMDGKELTALSGEVITVSISGSTVSLNDGQATVVTADLEASNGFIHIIDAVLTPPDPPISVRGFLIDLYCWQLNPTTRIAIDGADLDENPEEHTIHCMRDVPQCRANGFGIVVEQSDGTYDLVYGFDEAGNEAVLDWLDTNTADDNIGVEVTVTGVVTGNDVVLNDLTVAELTSVVVRFHRDVISHTGFLIDILCWEREGHLAIDGADLDTNPQDHSIKCMRDVPICREMGHGILEPVEDGCGYDLAYTFDEAGNALALEFIDSTDKLDNIIVSVSGEIDTAGIMYVETLVAEDYQIHEGYLMDYYCWTLNPETRTAFDGADLMNSPEEHSIKCMREVPQCRVNGFGLMQLNDEGTAYNYTIDFDDDGDATALAFVDDATIEDDVYVRIQGVPVPDAGTNYFTLTGISIELLAEECRPSAIEEPVDDPEVPVPAPTAVAEPVSCDSDDPDFDFALPLDGSLTFYWRLVGDTIQARLFKRGGGYASIAASNDEFMPNSDAIIGIESADAPSKYEITTRTTPSERGDSEQTLTETSTTSSPNGDVDYRFTKLLVEDGEIPLNAEGETLFIWAHGSGGLAFHGGNRGALALDLSSCVFTEISLKAVNSQAIKIHGILMIAAWSFCAPLGILFARLKHFCLNHGLFKAWLYCHAFLQVAMLVLTAIGFSIAYKAIKKSDVRDDHLTFRHPKLGVTTMVGAMTNVLMGILRPHPPHGDEEKSCPRILFEILHRVVGYGTAIVSIITQLAGIYKAMDLEHISQIRTWNIAVVVPICTTGFLGILATLYINFWMQPAVESGHTQVSTKSIEMAEDGKMDDYHKDTI